MIQQKRNGPEIIENSADIEMVFNKNKVRGFKYLKISKETSEILDEYFSKTLYPSKETYCEISEKTRLPITKIENWFKFQRKKHVGEAGNIKYQKRRILKIEEEKILEDHFRSNQNPSYETLKELAGLLHCKKKQIRNWFAYRRKKLNRLRRKRSHAKNEKNYYNKEQKTENKADSSSLGSNKIFIEEQNSTSSTSNQNTKKEFSNKESFENKGNSYESQTKTELNISYGMKNNAINNKISRDDENTSPNNEKMDSLDEKMDRMNANGNQPQLYFTNQPYFNNLYAYNPPYALNGIQPYTLIPSNVNYGNNQFRPYNLILPINQAHLGLNVGNVGLYPMVPLVGNQNQINQMNQINHMSQMSQMNQMNHMNQMNQMNMNQMNQNNQMSQMSQINPKNQMNQRNQRNHISQMNQINPMSQMNSISQMNSSSQKNSVSTKSQINQINQVNIMNSLKQNEKNQWLANVSSERSNGGSICVNINEMKQNEMNMNMNHQMK